MEYSKVEVRENTITIGLPEWISDPKYDRVKVYYFDKFHTWAGSYDRTVTENMIVDELFGCIRGVDAVMCHPMNCNIDVVMEDNMTINDVIDEINEVLDRFSDEEYVKEVTETIYVNKP